jgi:hypothetical protein
VKKLFKAILVAALLLSQGAQAGLDDLMKDLEKQLKVIVAEAKSGGNPANISAALRKLEDVVKQVQRDENVPMAISMAEFGGDPAQAAKVPAMKKEYQNFLTRLLVLRGEIQKAADANDMATVMTKAKEMRTNTCTACHDKFR